MSSNPRETGWGAYEKAQRFRQAEEKKKVIKNDFNDPFVFKRPKQQQPAGPAAASPAPQPTPQQPVQSPPAPAAPVQASPSPVAQTPVAAQQTPVASPSPLPNDETSPNKAPAVSPTPVAASSGPISLCSVLVELFEMVGDNPAPRNFGPKGVTLQRLAMSLPVANNNPFPNAASPPPATTPTALPTEPQFQLLVYAPVSKKIEFSVEINQNFEFTVLPDRFASFEDAVTHRSWCMKFGSTDDAFSMARCFAFLSEQRSSQSYARGGSRGIIKQDLAVGAVDGPSVAIGDQIKCKYAVYTHEPVSPFTLGRTLFSLKEAKKYIVGAGEMLSGVEECLVGMKKKGTRLLILPPILANQINSSAEWGPHVQQNTTLLVEVSIAAVRSSLPVNDEPVHQAATSTPSTNQQAAAAAGGGEADQDEDEVQAYQHYQQQHDALYQNEHPQQQQSSNSEDGTGVYNPTTSIAAQADLKTRMAMLANAQHTGGVQAFNPLLGAQQPQPPQQQQHSTPQATVNSSQTAQAPSSTQQQQQHRNSLTSPSSTPSGEPTIESLLSELQLTELLPNFKREGVTYQDLLTLDNDELKQLIPLMGPRRRISAKISELQQQKVSSAIQGAGVQQPNVAAAAAAVVAAKQGTPVAAATKDTPDHSSAARRARTQSDIAAESHPLPATSAAAAHATSSSAANAHSHHSASFSAPTLASFRSTLPASSQALLDQLLAAEYQRGQTDTVSLAREKINEMKETAGVKFQALQAEIESSHTQLNEVQERAREKIQSLREEVRSLQSERDTLRVEKDALSDKSQRFVQQLKDKMIAEREGARAQWEKEHAQNSENVIRGAMEELFENLNQTLRPKDLYEGAELMGAVKTAVKAVVNARRAK